MAKSAGAGITVLRKGAVDATATIIHQKAWNDAGDMNMGPALKTVEQQLADAQEIIRLKNLELNANKRTISSLQREHDTAEAIRKEIWGLSAHNPEPPPWISKGTNALGKRGCPITIWSDWHYGENVDLQINKFDADIAKQRIYRLYDTVADLSYNHMGRAKTEYPGIIVCLGGDMIGGDIHEELAMTNDRTPQQAVNDLTDIIAGGIEFMATKFGRVYLPCVVGNHGRSQRKPPAKNMVYTNYDWSIYANLARHFRKERHIRIDIPNGPDAYFPSYGTRFMLTHGDNMGVKGGDGIIGAIGPIMRGSLKVGAQQSQLGYDIDQLLVCHWHQMLWLPRCIVNGALKGPDEFSMIKLRAPANRPSQALFFNHPEHGITARWEVFLEGKANAAESKAWVSWQE